MVLGDSREGLHAPVGPLEAAIALSSEGADENDNGEEDITEEEEEEELLRQAFPLSLESALILKCGKGLE